MKGKAHIGSKESPATLNVSLPINLTADVRENSAQLESEILNYSTLLTQNIFDGLQGEINFSLSFSEVEFPQIKINGEQCRLPREIRQEISNRMEWQNIAAYCTQGIFQNRALFITENKVDEITMQVNNEFKNLTINDRLKICLDLVKYCYSISRVQLINDHSNAEALKENADWFEAITGSAGTLSLKIDLAPGLLKDHSADQNTADELLRLMSERVFYDLGVYCPFLKRSEKETLNPDQFQIWLNDLPLPVNYSAGMNSFLCEITDNGVSQNLNTSLIRNHPNYITKFSTRNIEELQSAKDENKKVLGTWSIIIFYLESMIRENSGVWMNKFVVQHLFSKLEYDPILKELFLKNYDIIYLTKVLRQLVSEGVPLRHLKKIIETVIVAGDTLNLDSSKIEFLPQLSILTVNEGANFVPNTDWQKMAELIRKVLREELSILLTKTYNINAFLLDWVFEKSLIDNEQPITDELRTRFIDSLSSELKSLSGSTFLHCILVTDLARVIVQQLIEVEYPFLKVLSYRELSPTMNIKPIGNKIALN